MMTKLDQYRGQALDSSIFENVSFEDRMALREAVHEAFLPKFTSGVFKAVAAAHYNSGAGVKAQFGKVSLLADGCAGRFLVTLSKGDSMITFGSCTERPFNHFRNPTLTSYYGSVADWSLMIDQVAQGLKRAERDGRKPLQSQAVFARMFGG